MRRTLAFSLGVAAVVVVVFATLRGTGNPIGSPVMAGATGNTPAEQATVDAVLGALQANYTVGDMRFDLRYALRESHVRVRPSELKLSIIEGDNFAIVEGAPIVSLGGFSGVIGDGRAAVRYVPFNVSNLYSTRMFYETLLYFLGDTNYPVLFARVPSTQWYLIGSETIDGVACHILEIPLHGDPSLPFRQRLYVDQATMKRVIRIEAFKGAAVPASLWRRWKLSYFTTVESDHHFPQRVDIETFAVGAPGSPKFVQTITFDNFAINTPPAENDPYFVIPAEFASLPLRDTSAKCFPLPF